MNVNDVILIVIILCTTSTTWIFFIIIATNPPTNVLLMRTSFSQAVLSWSPPASNSPIVQGYEVFYESPNDTRLNEDVGNSTMILLDDLDPELSYSAFVVAYGGDLPSAASNSVNISEGKLIFERLLFLLFSNYRPLTLSIIIYNNYLNQ